MNVSTEVLTVLSTALAFSGTDRCAIVQQLDRKEYSAVNKVLEALGGKWNKKAKAHIFEGEELPLDRIERVLATGTCTLVRDDLCFFPTPADLAEQLVDMIGVRGRSVLEPSAGMGALVDAILAGGAREVRCVERDTTMRELLKQRYLKNGKVLVSDRDDFMYYEGDMGKVDSVAMNPPFKKIGFGDHLDHVRHAFTQLASGGKLAAILPASVGFRQDRRHREFRGFIAEHRGMITDVPEGAVKTSGTNVRTCIVTLEVTP